jgi:periplasmic divalent cation tolerance protein
MRLESSLPVDVVIEVRTRLADQALAGHIAHVVVAERLAACAHVRGPLMSVYRWNDAIETAAAFELDAITTDEMVEALLARAEELHPYELPALLVTSIRTTAAYRRWVQEQAVTEILPS